MPRSVGPFGSSRTRVFGFAGPAAFARPSIYAAKRLSCGPGAERRDPTKQFYIKMFFYDPVVLNALGGLPRNRLKARLNDASES